MPDELVLLHLYEQLYEALPPVILEGVLDHLKQDSGEAFPVREDLRLVNGLDASLQSYVL